MAMEIGNNSCFVQYCEMLVCLLLICVKVLEDVKPFNYPVKFLRSSNINSGLLLLLQDMSLT